MELEQILDEIALNEEEALELYQLPEDTPEEELIIAFKERGISNWESNLSLLSEVADFELNEAFAKYIDKLKAYTEIRRDTFKLILKAIKEDSNKYDNQIDSLDLKVEAIVEELEGLESN